MTKSKSSSKEVGTIERPAISNLPAHMMEDLSGPTGKEGIERDDMIVPRVALTQAVSPEAIDGRCDIGHFWHTVLEKDLGETLNIVIVHRSKRYTLWNPRHAGGGVLARATDGKYWDADWEGEIAPFKDRPRQKIKISLKAGEKVGRDTGLGKWGTSNPEEPTSPPIATLSYVLVCFDIDRPEMGPFIIMLQRSAENIARTLLTKLSLSESPKIFGQKFLVGSKDEASDSGGYKQFTFALNGLVDDPDLYRFLKKQFEQFQSTEVKFDEAAAQTEVEPNTGGDDGGTTKGGRDY